MAARSESGEPRERMVLNMKILALIKSFRGAWCARASLESVYHHVDRVLYVHSDIGWTGEKGNSVRSRVLRYPDPEKKITHLDTIDHGLKGQENQHKTAIDHIAKDKIDFDYLMFLDTDEVWDEYNWTEIKPVLEENLLKERPAKAITCRLHLYIKSPFYRVDPPADQHAIVFLHRSALTMQDLYIRGCGVEDKDRYQANTVFFHHFCSVRKSFSEVWGKHVSSTSVEGEIIADKERWVYEVWNRLPFSQNLLPMPKYQHHWKGVKVIDIDDLPETIRKTELVLAWQCYPTGQYGYRPGYNGLTAEDLVSAGLPADFGPNHPNWTMVTKQNKLKGLINRIRLGETGIVLPHYKQESPAPAIIPPAAVPINSVKGFELITSKDLLAAGLPADYGPSHPDWRMVTKQNRLRAITSFVGKTAIFTIVSGPYQWYIPMFLYCIKKELPFAHPLVYIRGENLLPEPWRSECREEDDLNKFPTGLRSDGYRTAALRFVYSNPELEAFDYALITDCDMLMMTETPDFVNQHMRAMGRTGLSCYDNYISGYSCGRPKCPGVHFVTKDWWARTAIARETHRNRLMTSGEVFWEWDEVMLGWIIEESGLPFSTELRLWAHHGIHLGDWRRRLQMKSKYQTLDGPYQLFVNRLMEDKEFCGIADQCAQHVPMLKDTLEIFKKRN